MGMPRSAMQVWSWLLALSLTVALATARPEGGLAQGQQVVQDGAKDDDVASVELGKPDTRPEILEVVVTDDTTKGEVSFKEKEEAMKPLPVPIEPGVMTPDDSKVFPEGSLRSPLTVVKDTQATPLLDSPRQAVTGRKERASYLPAEARGADDDGLELSLPDLPAGAVLVPYYGGAKGQYLIVAQAARTKTKQKYSKKKPARPNQKEEEEENVGEETNEEKPPPSDSSDTVTIAQPPPNASMAEAKPVGIAVAGEGGVASSRPSATALVGPGGLAVARPIATAIAGIQGAELLLAGGTPQVAPATTLLYPIGGPVPHQLTTVYSVVQPGVHAVAHPVAHPLAAPLPLAALPDPWLAYLPPPPVNPALPYF